MYSNRFPQGLSEVPSHFNFVNPQTNSNSNFRFDTLLLFVLGSIGLIGFIYVFHCFVNPDNNTVTTKTMSQPVYNHNLNIFPLGQENTDEQLDIKGTMEINKPVEFVILNYNPIIDYTLDLGNGELLQMKEKSCKYTFKKSGNFNVQLNAAYHNKAKMLISRSLNIQSDEKKVDISSI